MAATKRNAVRATGRIGHPSAGRLRRSGRVVAWCGVGVLRAAALLPFPAIYRLGGWVGGAAARAPARPVRFAAVTIRTCFPGMGAVERQTILRAGLMESARMVGELGLFWTWPRERLLGLVRDVRGEEHLREARSLGCGVILLSPHIGAWELLGLYCSLRFPITVLHKQTAVTVLDRFIERGRARFGARLAPSTTGGVRMLARALAAGEAVGIMPDQEPRGGAGVFAPFFGVPAATTTLVWRLAREFGSPVLMAWAERLGHAAGFRVHFRPVSPLVHDRDPDVSTAALNHEIERLVRECPAQYLWSYKRFRLRPPGLSNPYRPAPHAHTAAH